MGHYSAAARPTCPVMLLPMVAYPFETLRNDGRLSKTQGTRGGTLPVVCRGNEGGSAGSIRCRAITTNTFRRNQMRDHRRIQRTRQTQPHAVWAMQGSETRV